MAVQHRLEPVETLILGQLRRGRPDRFQACPKSWGSPEHATYSGLMSWYDAVLGAPFKPSVLAA
jgi:hypothetical protein